MQYPDLLIRPSAQGRHPPLASAEVRGWTTSCGSAGRQWVWEHFASEAEQEFDRTIATFGEGGHPRYEIVPTGQVFDGEEAVRGYYTTTRTAFPDQRHDNVRLHLAEDAVIAEFDLLGTNDGAFYGLVAHRPVVPGAP